MTFLTRSIGLATLGLIAGVAYGQSPNVSPESTPSPTPAPVAEPAPAESTTPAPAATPQGRILRWADGFLYSNGAETILRQNGTAGRAANILRGVGNGFGNRIVVSNDPSVGGVTVIENSRNGFGNRIIIDGVEMDFAEPATFPRGVRRWLGGAAPARQGQSVAEPAVYHGRDNMFWSKKVWSDSYDCNLYWCAKTERWYRYHRTDDRYRPIPSGDAPTAPMNEPLPVPTAP